MKITLVLTNCFTSSSYGHQFKNRNTDYVLQDICDIIVDTGLRAYIHLGNTDNDLVPSSSSPRNECKKNSKSFNGLVRVLSKSKTKPILPWLKISHIKLELFLDRAQDINGLWHSSKLMAPVVHRHCRILSYPKSYRMRKHRSERVLRPK